MQLGEKDIPAFGFAAGVERIMLLLDSYPTNNPDVYVAWLGENTQEKGLEIANSLRDENIKTHIDYNVRSMKSHMKKANKLDVKYCIILGEDEMNKNIVLLKNFENRTQEEVSLEEAINIIKNK